MRTTISKFGRARGIVLSEQVLSELQLEAGSEVEIVVEHGAIQIIPVKKHVATAVLSSWDLQFQAAVKAGQKQKQEKNAFDGGLAH